MYKRQVWQSLIAFGSGGVIGKGYANGVQKYKYLPDVSTDFIFASYGEELGLIGIDVYKIQLIRWATHVLQWVVQRVANP